MGGYDLFGEYVLRGDLPDFYALSSHEVELWEVRGSGALRSKPRAACGPLAFSPDSKLIATTSYFDRSGIIIWETATNTNENASTNATILVAETGLTMYYGEDQPLEVSSDSNTIAVLFKWDGLMRIYDAKTIRQRCIWKILGELGFKTIAPMKFSLDMSHLAVSVITSRGDKKIVIWDPISGTSKQVIRMTPYSITRVNSIEFDSNGLFLTINTDISIKLNESYKTRFSEMDLATRSALPPPRAAGTISMSPDGM